MSLEVPFDIDINKLEYGDLNYSSTHIVDAIKMAREYLIDNKPLPVITVTDRGRKRLLIIEGILIFFTAIALGLKTVKVQNVSSSRTDNR